MIFSATNFGQKMFFPPKSKVFGQKYFFLKTIFSHKNIFSKNDFFAQKCFLDRIWFVLPKTCFRPKIFYATFRIKFNLQWRYFGVQRELIVISDFWKFHFHTLTVFFCGLIFSCNEIPFVAKITVVARFL